MVRHIRDFHSQFYDVQGRVAVPVSDPFDPTYITGTDGPQDAVVGVLNATTRGTGSILGDGQWVLTAAHVIFGESAEAMQIAVDLTSGRQLIGVTEYIIHPDYSPDASGYSSANDIALIRLAERAPVAGFDIYRETAELNSNFTLIGYGQAGTGEGGQLPFGEDPGSGFTKRFGQNRYDVIDGVTPGVDDLFGDPTPDGSLLFYDFDNGNPENDAWGIIADVNDTGLGGNEVNSTQGDSGGPTIINDRIAGIVSGGSTFVGENSPDIDGALNSSFGEISLDTRVSFFQSWIDGIVGNIFTGADPGTPIAQDPLDPPNDPNPPTDPPTEPGDPTDPDDPTDPTEPVNPPPPPDFNPFPLPLPGVEIQMPSSEPIANPPSDLPNDELVFRFFNTVSGSHFYTASEAERDNLIATRPDLKFEAPVFEAGEPFFPGSVEVFRLLNTVTGGHLFTTDQLEVSVIEATNPAYVSEGPVFRVADLPTGDQAPVYRFYNSDSGTHFFTINEGEKDTVIATLPNMTFEGIAWYATPV